MYFDMKKTNYTYQLYCLFLFFEFLIKMNYIVGNNRDGILCTRPYGKMNLKLQIPI